MHIDWYHTLPLRKQILHTLGNIASNIPVPTQQMTTFTPLNGVRDPPDGLIQATTDNQIVTITDLLLNKVRDTPDSVFIQYPATSKGKSDYVGYTVVDIDRLADEAARQYVARGLKSEVRGNSVFQPGRLQHSLQMPSNS